MASIEELQGKYESGGGSNKWRSGVQNPNRTPGDGLDSEVDDLEITEQQKSDYNSLWSDGADTEEAQEKYEEGVANGGDKWARNWGDASNWDLSGN